MEKTIKLYSVSCGLYLNNSLYPPFANTCDNYITDLNKSIELYDSIDISHFDIDEVKEAKEDGYFTYNKTLLCVEMPESIYNDMCLRNEFGQFVSETEKQERINTLVWHEKCKFQDDIKDQLFEFKGKKFKVSNLRNY